MCILLQSATTTYSLRPQLHQNPESCASATGRLRTLWCDCDNRDREYRDVINCDTWIHGHRVCSFCSRSNDSVSVIVVVVEVCWMSVINQTIITTFIYSLNGKFLRYEYIVDI